MEERNSEIYNPLSFHQVKTQLCPFMEMMCYRVVEEENGSTVISLILCSSVFRPSNIVSSVANTRVNEGKQE